MRTILKVAIFAFIMALIATGVAWHLLVPHYPADIRHYQNIMRKISSDEEIQRLRWYVGNDSVRPFIGHDYRTGEEYVSHGSLLSYLHAKVKYTKGKIIRHEDPIEILEYGLGRCGEFSIAYTALCLAYGYKARMVMCLSDHVWCEIGFDEYIITKDGWRIDTIWYHYDPTEKVFNDPYMYERNWTKNFDGVDDIVYAIESHKITIVTEKYRYLPNAFIDIIEETNMTVEMGEYEERPYWFHFTDFTYFVLLAETEGKETIFMDEQADRWVFWYSYDENNQCRYYLEKER